MVDSAHAVTARLREAANRGVPAGAGAAGAKTTVPRVTAQARDRLETIFDLVMQHRVAVVTAPAGSGKTTMLAQLAARVAPAPVAWYRADPSDWKAEALVAYLEHALTSALADLPGGWLDVDDATDALHSWHGDRALLVVDDLHALQGTPAEAALQRFLEQAPPSLTTVVASRHPPTMNVSRLRVAGDVIDINADDLRFRTWEVELLFRSFYREWLRPEDLAALARRTEGWAAGLQLFHLAIRGKGPEERRQMLRELSGHWGLVREYLTDNVLSELESEVRSFLLQTSVLGRLSGPVCDAYLGRSGGDVILAGLERNQVFTIATGDGWYRYHEVLRSHLEAALAEQVGEVEMRERHRRAGQVLEEAGALDDAFSAYCRAEDAAAVGRLLGHEGEQLAAGPAGWLEILPPAISDHDPWVLLAAARRDRAAGRWSDAVAAYRRAEQAFGRRSGGAIARAERSALIAWEDPALHRRDDWMGLLRAAAVRDPMTAATRAARAGTAEGLAAAGLAALGAGCVTDAQRWLSEAAVHPDCSATLAMTAQLGHSLASLLGGGGSAVVDLEWLLAEADRLAQGWLNGACRAAFALSDRPEGTQQAAAVAAECRRDGNRWGEGFALLLQALGDLGKAASLQPARDAAGVFAGLGAGTLHAWSVALAALAAARTDDEQGYVSARDAVSLARAMVVPGAEAIAVLAQAFADPERSATHWATASAVAAQCGLQLPVALAPLTPAAPTSVKIAMLGGFRMEVEGRTIDGFGLKPRARSLLRLLALSAGRPLHREVIVAALWPDADRDTGMRLLHVALSALRHALSPDAKRGGNMLLVRDGEAYLLALPQDSEVDIRELEAMATQGVRARAAGDREAAIAAFERVLWLHTDELLPEEGPAEWVVDERTRLRQAAADAAQALVELHVARGDTTSAALACSRGLHLDRYRDALWRMLIAIQEQGGDLAAAAHTRRRYSELLAELGVPPTSAGR
ncbi:MAG: hypothetical protein GEU74_14010 [Nitriliruptorales bacterium]|nr:hypothetical protein [Nitriliruptorales bacterium]